MPRKTACPQPGTRKYGIRSNYTPAALVEALNKIGSGAMTAYAASKEYKIPINTLKNKVTNKHSRSVGRPIALSSIEEDVIKKHICALGDAGIPISIQEVRFIIQKYLNSTNKIVKVFKNNLPGWEWGQSFLNRHSDLKQKFGHNISRSRAQVDSEKINQFFDHLEVELRDVPAGNIYNFDETGFHDNPQKKKLLFSRTSRNPEIIRNSTKSCFTVMFCGNAEGEMIPPYFIFKAKNTWSDWLIGAPPGSRMTVTKSGWIDVDSFDDWFKSQFLPIVSKKEGKKVLIGDNLSSHISLTTLKLCDENNIKFICLVPNSTHLLQPLDVGYFSGLKSNWRSVLLSWRQTARGKKAIALPKNCFVRLVARTLQMGVEHASANLRAGFRTCGIFPISREDVLKRLPDYAQSQNGEQAKECLGDSFVNYLSDVRNTDLGTVTARKFQMPITAGKSVSVEDVESYYKRKEQDKSRNPTGQKRGRPQGSKNKKKKVSPGTKDEEEEVVTDVNNDISLPPSIDGPSTSNISEIREEILSEIVADVDVPEMEEEVVIGEFVVENNILKPICQNTTTSDLSTGTMIVFKCEGTLFAGKVLDMSHPTHVLIATVQKCLNGGWQWPGKREVTKCRREEIVSIISMDKIKVKGLGNFEINDDLLVAEWGT